MRQLIILFVLLLSISACSSEITPIEDSKVYSNSKDEINNNNLIQYEVIRVIDGDTVELKNGERLRYNDIDTPETVHPSKSVECYGPEASEKNKELVQGEIIFVELGNPAKDKYGRLLGYVFIDDIFINRELIKGGYAEVNSYGNPGSKINELLDFEKKAKQKSMGLWGKCYK
jgi:micrococcal nuclease